MAEPTQRALFPGGRRPWSWLLRFFPEADRALAAEVLEADWEEMKRIDRHTGRGMKSIAFQYVCWAKKHPESLAWSKARNARAREAAAEPLKQSVEELAAKILGEEPGTRRGRW